MSELSEKEKVENLKNLVFEKEKEGKVVLLTPVGVTSCDLDGLIFGQPVDGLLYDLNRSEEVTLTFINRPKWVNDYAVALVIRRMSAEIERLKKIINDPASALISKSDLIFRIEQQQKEIEQLRNIINMGNQMREVLHKMIDESEKETE